MVQIGCPVGSVRIRVRCDDQTRVPDWNDVEVTTESGEPIMVKSVSLSVREGLEPVTATLEVYVGEIDVEVGAEHVTELPAQVDP